MSFQATCLHCTMLNIQFTLNEHLLANQTCKLQISPSKLCPAFFSNLQVENSGAAAWVPPGTVVSSCQLYKLWPWLQRLIWAIWLGTYSLPWLVSFLKCQSIPIKVESVIWMWWNLSAQTPKSISTSFCLIYIIMWLPSLGHCYAFKLVLMLKYAYTNHPLCSYWT